MKQIIFIALFSVIVIAVSGQNVQYQTSLDSPAIIRSTIGINGISKTFKTDKGTYIVSQSAGQSNVIGTHLVSLKSRTSQSSIKIIKE